jgi:hypothetical protein
MLEIFNSCFSSTSIATKEITPSLYLQNYARNMKCSAVIISLFLKNLNEICILCQNQNRIKKHEDERETQLIFIRHRRERTKKSYRLSRVMPDEKRRTWEREENSHMNHKP